MPVHNADIAALFDRLAELLEIEEANPFRVRAYRNAARTIRDLPRSAAEMVAAGEDLHALPGIGDALAAKIAEIVTTGKLAALEQVETRTPSVLAELTTIPGLGPKRVHALHASLGLRTFDEVRRAAERHAIRALPGFSERLESKILAEIRKRRQVERRFKRATAEDYAEPLLAHLRAAPGVRDLVVAGSYRRRRETVGDLDVLVTCDRPGGEVIDRLVEYDEVEDVRSKGKTRSSVVLRCGLQVDVRVVPRESYGAALHYFTGSRAHNIAVRKLGIARGLKFNEYGVFRGGERIAGRTEREIYAAVDLPYIEPELREDRGEIEAAREGRLPHLVAPHHIRGDLHVHTNASDGKATLREMALAARDLGYEYVAITDHSRHASVARGLDPKRLSGQLDAIDRLNDELEDVRILKGSEVDILADGTLDLPDAILARLDLTVCAVHYKFDLPERAQTERIVRSMDSPHFRILAHPSGRLINEREPYAVDLGRVLEAARDRGCFVEVNAHPARLDLDDAHCRMAKALGVKVAISTDAHSPRGLEMMRYGIDQARRGWLEPADVLNTRAWPALARLLRR